MKQEARSKKQEARSKKQASMNQASNPQCTQSINIRNVNKSKNIGFVYKLCMDSVLCDKMYTHTHKHKHKHKHKQSIVKFRI